MVFSQQVNIVYEFQKTCFETRLLEIAFRKKKSCQFKLPIYSQGGLCAPVKVPVLTLVTRGGFFWN